MNTKTGFIAEVTNWAKQPFQSGGSAFNWILFVGLLIIAAWMWNIVLLQIKNEI